jgi:hypothetical protein
VLLRELAVFGVVGAEFEKFLIVKSGRGHRGRIVWNEYDAGQWGKN